MNAKHDYVDCGAHHRLRATANKRCDVLIHKVSGLPKSAGVRFGWTVPGRDDWRAGYRYTVCFTYTSH